MSQEKAQEQRIRFLKNSRSYTGTGPGEKHNFEAFTTIGHLILEGNSAGAMEVINEELTRLHLATHTSWDTVLDLDLRRKLAEMNLTNEEIKDIMEANHANKVASTAGRNTRTPASGSATRVPSYRGGRGGRSY